MPWCKSPAFWKGAKASVAGAEARPNNERQLEEVFGRSLLEWTDAAQALSPGTAFTTIDVILNPPDPDPAGILLEMRFRSRSPRHRLPAR
jgi:hypothetical protein